MKVAKRVRPKHHCAIEQLEERRLLAVLFSDDFEGPFPGPWVISSTGLNKSASWGDNQAKFSSGTKSAFAADNGNDFRTVYDNDLTNTMQLQNVSLVGYSSAALSFNYWLNAEATFDFFYVRVRNQSGVWSTLLAQTGDQSAAGWQVRNLSLNSFIGQNNLIISFEFVSDDSVANPAPSGLWIDHVQLIGGDPTNLPGSITPGTGQRIWTNPFGDVTRNEAIDPASQVDVFAFNPDVSGSYIISTTQALDTQLRIYNASGQPISPVIDDTFSGETTTQSLFASNWYYIAVAGFTTASGPYTLNINGPDTSIFNVPVSAPSYAININSAIDWGGELDYFSFTAPAFTDTLTLTTTPSAGVDTYVELYDASGNLLQSNNGGGPGAQDLLTYPSIIAGQIYYVAVADASRTTTGSYVIKADFDPDSTAGDPPFSINPSAVPSTWIWGNPFGDVTSNGNIPTPVKFDLYAFMPDAGGNVVVTTSGPLDTQFRLYNSSGNAISNLIDANGPGASETLTIGLTSGVWYYIGIGGKGPSTGAYSLSLDGPNSPTPSIATAAPAYTGSVDGNLAVGGAREFYKLTAPPNTTTLNLTLTPLQSADTFLEVYDAAGALIASSNSGAQNAADLLSNVPISGGATYYVAASGFLRTTATTFRLQADFDPNVYSTIRGRVFVDRNSNGVADADEPGIPGWTIYLDLDDDGQHDANEPIRVTDANGEYSFADLIASTYHIAQLTQSDWLQTSPGPDGIIASFYQPPPQGSSVPEVQSTGKLQDQFVLEGEKWPQSAPSANVSLTYSYANLLNGGLAGGLTTAQLRAAIEEALALWAKYAPLTFVEVPDVGPPPADASYTVAGAADLRFGYHFIDGVSNTLAHAYSPPPNGGNLAGDVHFDSGETWGLNTVGNVIDILEVAVHEIGHALGLGHETGTTAIMNPIHGNNYDGLGTAFLFPDDIAGIQAIYGTRLPRPGTWRIDLDQGETAADVNFGNFPTSFTGTANNDGFGIRLDPADPSRLQISQSTGLNTEVIYSIDKTRITTLHYDALGGDDDMIIEAAYGNPMPPGGLIFSGGSGYDSMLINGAQLTFNYDLASVGWDGMQVSSGAQVRFLASQHLGGINLTTGAITLEAPMLRLNSIFIGSAATLDLVGNAMIDANDSVSYITGLVKNGRLRSSAGLSNRRLGVIQNINPFRGSFLGETNVTFGSILVLYTLIGDLNLDKSVSIADFIDLAAHFGQSGAWREGDVNYDGVISISDFIDLASNFNQSFAGDSEPIATPQPASSTSITSHPKKHHRHHHRPVQHVSPHPRLFRFE